LLAKWNRTTNLTAFDLDRPSADAVDRLIVEPIVASEQISGGDHTAVDLGSGGGSPGIPLAIARPSVAFRLVESVVKKVAFLRHVVRELQLSNVDVDHARFQDVATRPGMALSADLITMRAVRADSDLWNAVDALLALDGSVFWFGSETMDTAPPPSFVIARRRALIPSSNRLLLTIERRRE
jgi:16S rRNA (guanine527-N7)-methyltransferase